MVKYHINKADGSVGLCRATQGKCPFGGADQHFTSREAANLAYEKSMEAELVVSHAKPTDTSNEYVKDYRTTEDGGYAIEKGPKGYRWVWTEPDANEEGSEGNWYPTLASALREAAQDWEDSGDNSRNYTSLLKAAATREEKKTKLPK